MGWLLVALVYIGIAWKFGLVVALLVGAMTFIGMLILQAIALVYWHIAISDFPTVMFLLVVIGLLAIGIYWPF